MVMRRMSFTLTSVRRLSAHVPTEKHTFCPAQDSAVRTGCPDEVKGGERLWLREVSEAVVVIFCDPTHLLISFSCQGQHPPPKKPSQLDAFSFGGEASLSMRPFLKAYLPQGR